MYHHFRIIKYLLALLFVFHNIMLRAQAPTGTAALWSELEEQIQKGNKRALRDLGTFLDKPDYADATRRTLMRYTFFTKNEINLSLFLYEPVPELIKPPCEPLITTSCPLGIVLPP